MEFTKPEVIAVGALMVSVIGAFWKMFLDSRKKDIEQLGECRKMHVQALNEVKTLTGEVNYLKGKMDGVAQLSSSVLSKLDELKNDAKDSGTDQ